MSGTHWFSAAELASLPTAPAAEDPLAARIRAERLRLGYTQPKFAAIAGYSKRAQLNWECGRGAPNAHVLAAWSRVGVDVLYIINGELAPGGDADEQVAGAPAFSEQLIAGTVAVRDEMTVVTPTTRVRTPEQVSEWFRANGISVSDWCRQNGINRYTVIDLLRGHRKGHYGEAHRAAVALQLKTDPEEAPQR